MKTFLALVLLTGVLAVTPAAAAPGPQAAAADATRTRAVVLDGVRVALRPGTSQVVTVNRTRGHHARVTLWRLRGGTWEQRMQAQDGRIGYGGLVPGAQRRQGSGTTPLGTYRLPWAFGTRTAAAGEEAGWRLPYRQVRRGDFWVQDNASPHYNRYRNQRQGGFRWRLPSSHPDSSERLTDYRRQYEYAVVVKYNWGQVRHRGSDIFLHVNGSGATAGCVSAPRAFLARLMARLDPARVPLIAVGR